MSIRSVTKDNVMRLLTTVVNHAGGEYKDPNAASGAGCTYADANNKCASCIVGRVFELAGFSFEELYALDSAGTITDVAYARIHTLTDHEQLLSDYVPEDILPSDFEMDLHSIAVLKAAQRDQDHNNDWSYALSSAEIVHRMLKHGANPLAYLDMMHLDED